MKNNVIACTFLFFCLIGSSELLFADCQTLKNENSRFVSVSELNDSLTNLKSDFAGFEKNQSNDQTVQQENANNTIAYLNSVVGTFSNYLTLLGIFIGIIALVVPFATYQYAVKPSREILRDLESYFEKRLETYLWENRKNQIDNAIHSLKEGTIEEKNNAVSFLTFTQYEGLTEDQLYKVYSYLKSAKIESNLKSQLAFLLTHKATDFASEYFNSQQILDDPYLKNMAYIYFAKTGYTNNYPGIKRLIQQGDSPEIEFTTLFNILNQYNSDDLNRIINDPEVIDLMPQKSLLSVDKIIPQLLINLSSDVHYNSSYLYKKVQDVDD